MKLVGAILRVMGDFIASGGDALVMIEDEEVTPGPPESTGAETTASNWGKRAVSMSPALRELLSAVIASLSDDETARYLAVSVRQVRRRALDGSLYYFQVGRRRRYPCWQFGDEHNVLPGLRTAVPAIPQAWSPERVQKFMKTPHRRLQLNGTLTSPAEWLMAGGRPDDVGELLSEQQPQEGPV